MVPWWVPAVLLDMDGFGRQARPIYQGMADAVLRLNLTDWINTRSMDALHAYEEGQNIIAHMPMLFYGQPRWIEEVMTAARSIDKLLIRTPDGARPAVQASDGQSGEDVFGAYGRHALHRGEPGRRG